MNDKDNKTNFDMKLISVSMFPIILSYVRETPNRSVVKEPKVMFCNSVEYIIYKSIILVLPF